MSFLLILDASVLASPPSHSKDRRKTKGKKSLECTPHPDRGMVTKVVFRWTTRTNPGISGDEVVVVEGEVALEGSGEGGVVVEVITIRRVTLRVFCLGET